MKINEKNGQKPKTKQTGKPNIEPAAQHMGAEEKNLPENGWTEFLEEDENMAVTGESPIDDLQASVFEAGKHMLAVIRDKDKDAELEKTDKALHDLSHFIYNIGFAGEQSCGKSTVINSLLQYPLMPTCQLTTTASVVRIAYSEHFRVRASDDDTKETILDFDCEMPQNETGRQKFCEQFNKLLDYGVSAMKILVIENFQYYADVDVKNYEVTVDDIEMHPDDPRHVMLLMFMLLAVYVGQNDESWSDETAKLMEKRKALFQYFGIPKDAINISVFGQADFDLLKSGLMITDLPGLGSNATEQVINGKKVKGHDEITKEAIRDIDTMVFLTTPENHKEGYAVLPEMISSARLKEIVYKGDRIIPVLNRADCSGELERAAAIKSFCKAMTSSGVDKKPEDIVIYSAIFGEYNYTDTPFDRTLYFMKNYNEKKIRQIMQKTGCSMEEAREQRIDELREDLQFDYENSGIEKLKHFFRSTYVEGGKYSKSLTAVSEIRSLFLSVVSKLENAAMNCRILSSAQTAIMQDMVKGLESAVKKPIAEITLLHTRDLEIINEDVELNMEPYFNSIPMVYTNAFQTALEGYKDKLLKIMSGFDLNWAGLGSKALISGLGSANRERYLKLMKEIDDFQVSLVEVNCEYEKMLEFSRKKIDRFYEDTLKSLEKLKGDIRDALKNSVEKAGSQNLCEDEMDALEQLKEQVVLFVDKQIEITKENFNNQQQVETDAQREIIDSIFNLNKVMTEQYADSIKSQLKSRISSGFFFSSKEYLLIDGEDGIKTAICKLNLTDKDSENVKANLDAGVNGIVRSKIPEWVDDLYNILGMYSTLSEQIEGPMSDMVNTMSNSVEENQKKLEDLNKEIEEWREIGDSYKQEVQPYMRAAYSYIMDKEPRSASLQEDLLYGCFTGAADIAP